MKIARIVVPAIIGWVGAVSYWIAVGPDEAPEASADAAVVLGAAVDGDTPSPVFRERIAHAIDLHQQGRVSTLIFTGGQAEGDTVAESEAGRAMAIEAGVPAEAILIETDSLTTMQNLVDAQLLMRDAGLENALIVSDPLHLRRATEMAEALGLDAQASATPTTRYQTLGTQAPFLAREVYFMHHFWLFGE
ncbi:YdcF family protein [Erythrobacter alti]|uniref:YdcF family protein n=1 Tax=Erythrobacter alti TaxID=1896145 RepID=UPI0030F40C9B